MLAKDLISDSVPVLKTSDTGIQALNWMEISRVSHLPIVNNKEFLGLISDTDIYDLNMAEEPVGNHYLSLQKPFVTQDQHIFEVIEMVDRLKLTTIPVLDNIKHYIGLITLHDLLKGFSKITAFENRGSIIILEVNSNDYFLSQIAQIIESNDAKILSLYVSLPNESTKLEVTIKLNTTNITAILQTFVRYEYIIKAHFLEEDEVNTLYQNRYDSFMRYLNI